MEAFGCATISSDKALIVGGAYAHVGGGQPTANLFDVKTGAFEQIATMEDEGLGQVCGKITLTASSSPPGEKVILCTLGRRTGVSQNLLKTYVYHIATGTFERKMDWDFPTSGLESSNNFPHVIAGKMYVKTPSGVFEFRDGEEVPGTGSHWFEAPQFAWPDGVGAEFDLKYVHVP